MAFLSVRFSFYRTSTHFELTPHMRSQREACRPKPTPWVL